MCLSSTFARTSGQVFPGTRLIALTQRSDLLSSGGMPSTRSLSERSRVLASARIRPAL